MSGKTTFMKLRASHLLGNHIQRKPLITLLVINLNMWLTSALVDLFL